MATHVNDANKSVARKVLRQAARADGFFDFCQAEQLVWMLCLAAKLGADAERRRAKQAHASASPTGERASQ